MRRTLLTTLLLLSTMLTGCFWGGALSGPLVLTVSLGGTLAESQELLVEQGSTNLLMELSGETDQLKLPAGTWKLTALSRDGQGMVVASSLPTYIEGGGARTVQLTLEPTLEQTAVVRAEGLNLTWLPDGSGELSWEGGAGSSVPGHWEIWVRDFQESHWKQLGQVQAAESSWKVGAVKGLLFAVRFAPLSDSHFPGPLTAVPWGTLDLSWEFLHEYPPAALGSLAFAPPAVEQEPTFSDLVAHFKSESSFAERAAILAELGLRGKGEIPSLLVVLVEPERAESLAEWVGFENEHLFLEPNWEVRAEGTATAAAVIPWLDYIKTPQAHGVTKGSTQVRIAVVDSGLLPGALPSSAKLVPGYNFVANNGSTIDDYKDVYHGTEVAKSIAAIIPKVSIQPVKVLGSNGFGSDFAVANGILYAAGLHDTIPNPHPAQVINLSLGSSKEFITMRRAVERVVQKGDSLLVAASGNTRTGVYQPGVFYPAAYPGVVAVGAVEPSGGEIRRAHYSHFGPELDLVALIPSEKEGTSFAAPVVAGVAGLVLSTGASLDEVTEILIRTAMDLGPKGFDWEYGYGLVNAHWAVVGVSSVLVRVKFVDGPVVWEGEVPLEQLGEVLDAPPGRYLVEVWVNLSGGSKPKAGDYYAAGEAEVEAGGLSTLQLTLTELAL